MSASEDFSFFLNKKPGCFFFLGAGKEGEKEKKILHSSNYDYNDEMLAYGAYIWIKLVENRFNV